MDADHYSALPDYDTIFEGNKAGKEKGVIGKILLKFLRENLWMFLLSQFLYFLKSAAIWIIPVVSSNIINIATKPSSHSINELWTNGFVALFVLINYVPFNILYVRVTSKALRNIGAGLRNTVIKKLQHLSITYHKEIESGRLQAKFLRDIDAIEGLVNQILLTLIPCVVIVIVSFTLTIMKSWEVAMFFLAVIPLSLSVIKIFGKSMRKRNKEFREQLETMSARMSDMLEMIPVTKAHGLEEEEVAKIEDNIKDLKAKALKLDQTNGFMGSASFLSMNVISVGSLFFTCLLAYFGQISVGDIVMYQFFFNIIMGQTQTIINIFPTFTSGMEAINSVSEIMLSNEIEDFKDKIRLRYIHGTIEFKNAYYRYPRTEKDVLKDFTLRVEPGECVAFVGSSGSGKSTVMNMIIGFLPPTQGVLKIDGKEVDQINLQDYRKFIAVVPQNSILFTGTIRENITYGLSNVSDEQIRAVMELANLNEFIDKLPDGVDTQIGEHGGKLSGGQKQRISIARAMIRNPQIIILDEATSALDNISEYQVQKAMSSLIKGRTTFIVAHRLSTIRDADKIVVMEDGEMVEYGSYDELMAKKGKFYTLKNLSEMKMDEEA